MKNGFVCAVRVLVAGTALSTLPARAAIIFQDDFASGPSPLWAKLTNGFAFAVMRDNWSVVDKRLMAQGQPKISAVRTGVRNAAFSVMVK